MILLLTTSVLATGALLSSVQTATAAGTIDSSVVAGDNYWYTVTEFTPIQNLVDNILQDALGGEELPEGFDYTFTGGFQGSEIYVKVLDINSESMEYWDGSNEIVGTLPTIDVAVGMITGQAMSGSVDIPDEDGVITTLEAAVPAGLGLPIPLIFGSATTLNISSFPDLLLPVPFILNNDFDVHETVLNQLKTMFDNEGIPGSVSVTSDDAILSIGGDDIQVDEQGHMFISFLAGWRKSDGALQEINFQINNQTSATEWLNIDIDLDRKENVPLYVEIGDQFQMDVDDLGFDFSISGFGEDAANVGAELDNVRNQMASLVGQTLIDFEVVDVDGLWYQVEGFIYDPELQEMVAVPSPETTGNVELWMLGFGRLGPGMPQNFMFGGFYEETFSPEVRRYSNLPGIVVSPDWDIYQAWDLTEATAAELGSQLLVEALELAETASQSDNYSGWIDFSSSTTDSPIFDASFASTLGDSGYQVTASVSMDVVVEENNTWEYWYYNETSGEEYYVEEGWGYYLQTQIVDGTMTMDYDLYGTFEGVSLSGEMTMGQEYENSEGDSQSGTVEMTNMRADFSVSYTPLNPRGPLDGSTDPSGSDNTPGAFAGPEFSTFLALTTLSIFGMVVIRRRQN